MKVVLKVFLAVLVGLLLLIPAGLAALALYDWNEAKPWIEQRVLDRTGRELRLAGDLQVHPFSLHPGVRAEGISFANADWGEKQPMLEAQAVEFSFSLPRLLFQNRIVIPELKLEQANLLLQRQADGKRNWILKPPGQTDEGRSPEILSLPVSDSSIRIIDRITNSDVRIGLKTAPNEQVYAMDLVATGRARGVPLQVKGGGGNILSLMDETTPYPIRLQGTLGSGRFRAEGTLTGVSTLNDLDVRMTLEGGNLAPLGELLAISLPHTRPYKLSGSFSRRGPDWTFRQFSGAVGESNVAGDFNVNTAGARPVLNASLRSTNLDIADLGGFIGMHPGEGKSTRAPGKVLPSDPINLEKLRRVDAHVRLVATHIQNPDLPLDDLDAKLDLEDGLFKLQPIVFGVAGGKMESRVSVDARRKHLAANVDASFRELHLGQLIPGAKMLDQSLGAIDGRLRLAGQGDSIAAMLGTSSGRIDLLSAGGEVSNLMMEYAGADVAEILKFWAGGDQEIQLRCAVVSLDVKDGAATSTTAVVDTDDTYIGGTGGLSLRDETLNFRLTPLPKDMSILSLRGPLYINGTFKAPKFGLEKAPLARKIAASALLALLNPLAAVLPLIETGPGKDAACGELVAHAKAAVTPDRRPGEKARK
jgi:uncharacterized protein involved in outer membrane biogenesis